MCLKLQLQHLRSAKKQNIDAFATFPCRSIWFCWSFHNLNGARSFMHFNRLLLICWTARSMERSIFFFLKSHISTPVTQTPWFFGGDCSIDLAVQHLNMQPGQTNLSFQIILDCCFSLTLHNYNTFVSHKNLTCDTHCQRRGLILMCSLVKVLISYY